MSLIFFTEVSPFTMLVLKVQDKKLQFQLWHCSILNVTWSLASSDPPGPAHEPGPKKNLCKKYKMTKILEQKITYRQKG